MKPIDRPADVKASYQDRGVVGAYMTRRTAQPLNGMLLVLLRTVPAVIRGVGAE
jgi:hypothetical protein